MNSTEAAFKIENALNKLGSADYQNISLEHQQDAANQAALSVCRKKIPFKESSIQKIDDLQVLLVPSKKLAGSDKGRYFLSSRLPADYLGYSRVTPICTKDSCIAIPLPSDLIEDSNSDIYLSDWSQQPSFDFEQCFHTFASNRVKVFHNGNFEVKEIDLSYYRKPQYIQFPGATLSNGTLGKDMTWEFKEDICELIIDEAVRILAGNIENQSAYQVKTQQVQEKN